MTQREEAVKTKMAMVFGLAGAYLLHSPRTFAQAAPQQNAASPSAAVAMILSDRDIDLMRRDIRSQKKQIVASSLKLTDSEATKFWPIYDQYTQEQIKINDQKFALIKQYTANWGTMKDDQAALYVRQWLEVDEATTKLRSKYVPIVGAVLPGVKTATFFQMDRRIGMMADLQISSQVPLVQDQQ